MADSANAQAKTTGHVWDGDLQEYNNPLPAWWTYAFYITILFALVYWVFYPSWPVGKAFLTGISKVSYTNADGQEESWHWNTRSKLLKEMQEGAAAQKPYYDKLMSLPYENIARDPELNSFVLSAGKAVFSENCAACHQAGGQGVIGLAPNLTDDNWIYGSSFDKINETISKGRSGYMPPFGEALSAEQIDDLSHYVLALSGESADAGKAGKGKALFHSQTAACYYCHGENAKGRTDLGSANLTDKIWLWADVPGAADTAGKVAEVKQVIVAGMDRGVMPPWEGRLTPEQIKLLAVYVHQLGGGK